MHSNRFLLFSLITCFALGCGDDDTGAADASVDTNIAFDAGSDTGETDAGDIDRENPTWTPESHENGVPPDFATVFPDDVVQRIDLTINADDWAAMRAELSEGLGGGGGRPGGTADVDFTPMWVEATLAFNGQEWRHTGVRFKGNSSLRDAFRSGGDKFPFKLDFDEWEDLHPSVDNQRFFGFKQLNLGSNYKDSSFMREKVASDLFRAFGVPAAHVAFCEVWLDRGEGLRFIGVYSLVEEVDDTVYEEQFPDDEGNLYKPDGDAATFALGTFDREELDLKTNEEDATYADVMALYDVLHDPARTSDEAAWMSELEAVFDVDGFLRYLAVNQVIQNWDTYGMMTHNYFLYGDQGVLTWIPWDNNEALATTGRAPLSIELDEVGADWPLIRYLLDVDVYRARYYDLARQFVEEHFNAAEMTPLYDAHEATLNEVANREDARFNAAVEQLRSHAASREAAVQAL